MSLRLSVCLHVCLYLIIYLRNKSPYVLTVFRQLKIPRNLWNVTFHHLARKSSKLGLF